MALFSKAPELSGLCDDAKWGFGNVPFVLQLQTRLKNPAVAGDGENVKTHFLLSAPKESVSWIPKEKALCASPVLLTKLSGARNLNCPCVMLRCRSCSVAYLLSVFDPAPASHRSGQVQQAVFTVYADFLQRNFPDWHTGNRRLACLEKALCSGDYGSYLAYCKLH